MDLNKEPDEKSSRINSAGIINITLENLWRDSYNAMSKGNYLLWNTKLDCIWAVLGGDVKDNDEEDKKFNLINKSIYECGNLSPASKKGFKITVNPNKGLIYQNLLRKALFLRRLQNFQGKGTAYTSNDEYDVD